MVNKDPNPILPITFGVLTWGPDNSWIMRYLEHIYKHTPVGYFKLRIGMNDKSQEAIDEILAFVKDKPNFEGAYVANPQIYKQPMVGRIFRDPNNPITTKWIGWMDEDTWPIADEWLDKIVAEIPAMWAKPDPSAPNGIRAFGKKYFMHVWPMLDKWVKTAKWFRGKPYAARLGKAKIDFARGGYWLMPYELLIEIDWPDRRLRMCRDDVFMGEALHQAGYGTGNIEHDIPHNDKPAMNNTDKHVGELIEPGPELDLWKVPPDGQAIRFDR